MQQYKRFAMSSLSEPKVRRLLLACQHEDTIFKTPLHFSTSVEIPFQTELVELSAMTQASAAAAGTVEAAPPEKDLIHG